MLYMPTYDVDRSRLYSSEISVKNRRLDKNDTIQKIKQSIEARAETLSPNVAYEIWGYAEQTFSTGQILTLDKVYYKDLEVAFEYETLDHIKSFTA